MKKPVTASQPLRGFFANYSLSAPQNSHRATVNPASAQQPHNVDQDAFLFRHTFVQPDRPCTSPALPQPSFGRSRGATGNSVWMIVFL